MYTYRNIKEEMRQLQDIIDEDSSHLFNKYLVCPKVQLEYNILLVIKVTYFIRNKES